MPWFCAAVFNSVAAVFALTPAEAAYCAIADCCSALRFASTATALSVVAVV